MNLPWKRKLFWLALLSAIIVALAFGFKPQPRPVDIAEVKRGPMRVSVEAEGKSRVTDRYIISAPVAGTTCRANLDVGDFVDKDQTLISIEPLQSQALDPRSRARAESRVAAAESALRVAEQNAKSAEAESELAATELKRLQPLAEKGLIARTQLDQAATLSRSATSASRSADFSVDVAKHELEAARTALQYSGASVPVDSSDRIQLLAPVSGRILKIQQECEGVVTAGQPLMEIGDTRSLEIETDVLSADAVKIRPGMRVELHRWGGDEALEGRVRNIEPVGFTKVSSLGVEEQRVLVISDITSKAERWQELGDGYRVEAEFILWEDKEVLQIPASALFQVDDHWNVFVMEDKTAVQRAVTVGQHNGLSAHILEGLEEGELIITHPDDSIEEGVSVKPR